MTHSDGMNLCIVSSGYPPSDAGGIGTYSYTLATGLSQLNGCVVVVLAKDKTDLYSVESGVHVYRKRSYFTIPLIEKFLPGISWSIYVYFWLRRNNKIYGFNVVEFPNWEAPGLISQIMMRRIKSVVRVHTPFFETLEIDGPGCALADKMACYQEKKSCLKADLLVSSTHKHATLIASEYAFDVSRIKIVPLGVIDRFGMDSLQLKHERVRSGFRILYVSRLEHRKGTLLLLDSLPHILRNRLDIRVDIIGRDRPHAPGRRYFQDYFREQYGAHDDQVNFYGFVEDGDLDEFYKAADIFLVPSVYESFGLIYAEAMMYGLPSIATDAGGIPEVITDQLDGLLLKEKSVDELVASVVGLYNDPIMLKRLSFNARLSFELKLDQSRMVNEAQQAYKKLMLD